MKWNLPTFLRIKDLSPKEKSKSRRDKEALPPSLEWQYDIIYDAISHANVFSKEISSMIALWAMSVGFKTDFRRRYITYQGYDENSCMVARYNAKASDANAPDYQNLLLNFSFRGHCTVRFKIHEKGDAMWLGVVGDPRNLDESKSLHCGRGALWSYYCGRADFMSDSEPPVDIPTDFKPELCYRGYNNGEFGCLHFPNDIHGRFFPANSGDEVDLEVNAQEKTFKVTVNGMLQADTRAPGMPDQLSFWAQLDWEDDEIEFEVLDFSFMKKMQQVGKIDAEDEKYVKPSQVLSP